MYINFNEIKAMELQPGDQVICTDSRVSGRVGTIFTVKKGKANVKEHLNNLVEVEYLDFLHVYGDQFRKVNI